MVCHDNPSRAVLEKKGGAPKWLGEAAPKIGEKLGRTKDVASVGFGKTKAVASVGFEKSKVAAWKIKVGAAVGFNWIKRKFKKSKLFHKKKKF